MATINLCDDVMRLANDDPWWFFIRDDSGLPRAANGCLGVVLAAELEEHVPDEYREIAELAILV
ncbi:MAG: hypothetical protein HY360_16370, partial [Verrucomicrobia bacterium]|nr:hypothetical protein [Verrucomicrobiota bacterium]